MTRLAGNPSSLPKRLYRLAALRADADRFVVLLDGKPANTRAHRELGAASKALADAMVDEWNVQIGVIDFAAMPMSRFQLTAIDRGDADASDWRAATLAFMMSDLVCYRAASPADLAARQAAAWDPLMVWARTIGIALTAGTSAAFIDQPEAALIAASAALDAASPAELLGIKTAAEISGSAVIALALWRGAFAAERLFEASRIDEDYQAEKWGADADAESRVRLLRRDFLDAARYLSLTSPGASSTTGAG
ncbi:MAG: ATP12 family protein [Parvularculaceae bacterium]